MSKRRRSFSHLEPETKETPVCPVRMRLSHVGSSLGARTQAMHLRRTILHDAITKGGFPYLHQAKGHRSCINALAFSRGPGQWMASGGDDMRIHIRDLFDFDPARPGPPETSSYRTRARLLGHTSNIFSLSWSADNKYLFSGGNDNMVLCYDLNYGEAPIHTIEPKTIRHMPTYTFGEHDGSVREVSTHPTNPNLCLTCNDDGQVFLIDLRLPSPQLAGAGYMLDQVASSPWNPNPSDGNTFAIASGRDHRASVALYDVRTAFHSSLAPIDKAQALVRYASQVVCRFEGHTISASPDTTGAQFDPSGRFIVAEMSLSQPVLYATDDSMPLATMSSRLWHPSPPISDDAGAGYRNSCTIKRGSFGFESLAGQLYFVAGSDDFRAYGWEVPGMEALREQRTELSALDWAAHTSENTVWFRGLEHGAMVLPCDLSSPAFTLEGSQSIVNSALCHPTLPMIATAGIERMIRLHYATPMSMEHTRNDYAQVRPRTRTRSSTIDMAAVARAMRRHVPSHAVSDSDAEEENIPSRSSSAQDTTTSSAEPTAAELADQETIALFDQLLEDEEGRTLFVPYEFHLSDSSDTDSIDTVAIDSMWATPSPSSSSSSASVTSGVEA